MKHILTALALFLTTISIAQAGPFVTITAEGIATEDTTFWGLENGESFTLVGTYDEMATSVPSAFIFTAYPLISFTVNGIALPAIDGIAVVDDFILSISETVDLVLFIDLSEDSFGAQMVLDSTVLPDGALASARLLDGQTLGPDSVLFSEDGGLGAKGDIRSASVTTAIPLPASLPLLLTGLASLAIARTSRQRAA